MVRTKILDLQDLKNPKFIKAKNLLNAYVGYNWAEVPCRTWEYCAAAVFSDVIDLPGKAMDAGCGRSRFPEFLAKLGCEVYAIDPGIKIGENRNGVCYRHMSMTNICGFDNWFDYVFAISSIEHVNAGKFQLEGMNFDTGDTNAMLELCRILKPGGILILTTDIAEKYYPPPGLWPSGSHRVYDWRSLNNRLIKPSIKKYKMQLFGDLSLMPIDWSDIKQREPIGYDYTEMILTMRKPK